MEGVTGWTSRKSLPSPPVRPSSEARQLEGVFLGMVVNEMLAASAPKTMNGGHGEEMFRTFLGNEIGLAISESGGIGLAEDIDRSMGAAGK
ncbi:rod-binding protein [Paracoccus litorisediminis]|uniref:rod-binding protein n=1 Tax=Paracoccus litorisediminis TaxID=2006130 RepID=UPI003730300A